MDKSLRTLLDQTPTAEIDAYLKTRRRDEYLSKGAVDGWERTSVEIEWETDHAGYFIEDGSWVWRDEAGLIRRAFGYLGSSYAAAMTFDAEGNDVCSWELRDDRDLCAKVGGHKNIDLDNDEHLALIRASLTAVPITRERA